MTLDDDICYRALGSRDARFDGRFFTGVLTTGVYCRPVCPAKTPRRANVRFFACAAAAEAAGFRPCLRCRPETSPGTPAWSGSSATVSRALRLISQGFLDTAGVDELAAVLGVGARQLRRLFGEHLGASPSAVAATRRVHFARRLLDETDLPVTEVAFSAGFGSIRRFNDAFSRVFGRPPSQVRRPARAARQEGAALRLTLPLRSPMDWDALLDFLRARSLEGVEAVGEAYRRTVTVDGAHGVIAVERDGERRLALSVPVGASRSLQGLVERARRVFDLGADPLTVGAHLARDPALAPLVRARPGVRVPGAWEPFEAAVRAIVGQQVSLAAARTVGARFAREFGEPVDGAELTRAFPTPERLRGERIGRIVHLGVTRARARAIVAVAEALCAGDVDPARPDPDALECIDGVGPWTAQYIAMRAFGDPDAFPSGDLGLLRCAREYLGVETRRELEERAEAWRPWRAYAAHHLWTAPRREEALSE
jgi:AraC family transcriptional regulator of adaptative response / DNA-3-methyladenine glycosylase II